MLNTSNWKQKMGLMGLGSVFTIIGMLFTIGMLPSVTAQRDTFGVIECTELRVVDATGNAMTVLGSHEHGGDVAVNDRDGNLKLVLDVTEHGGKVTAYGKDVESLAVLAISEHGGAVDVAGKDGSASASLSVDQHGGHVSVRNKDGKTRTSLAISEHGGFVQVKGKSEGAAVMGINECGNGGVSTCDKNGYRE